ncbi:MAG TPA: hypothetical protein V6C97_27205 [Oculatellaceae cyanobacterium]
MVDYTCKNVLRDEWVSYVKGFSDWRLFVTLTFRDIVTRDQCEHLFGFLVQVLNRDLYGNHYTRIVHHSYFSYCVGFEYQVRGALHMHVLVDQPLHLTLLHSVWQNVAGFAWVDPANDRAVKYVSKYVTKGGDLAVWKQSNFKMPAFVPLWFSSSL